MSKYRNDEIIKFITLFNGNEDFLNSLCYWFAFILKGRFPGGDIWYDPIMCHFYYVVDGIAYDVRGEVELPEKAIYWSDYKSIDEAHYYRILHCCILKDEW